ncbi:MAG TPA: hypothetical protein VK452_09175 [Dissulfurispiraceae bacterium]|nr:hypothetical protein [Dissulfurispiraceae bacterium]
MRMFIKIIYRYGICILVTALMCCLGLTHGIGILSAEEKCDLSKGACMKTVGDSEVTLDISPKPVKAMESLIFSVHVKGVNTGDNLVLELAMPGMYMGDNHVLLKKAGESRYSGEGVIPRCHSGKTLWSATVDLPGKGQVEFPFDVLY